MKNAKMTAWILIVVLLLGCAGFPAGAQEDMKLLSIVAIEGETIWVHTSAGLTPFDAKGGQIGAALYPGMDCYAIGSDGNVFCSIDGDIFEYDREGSEVERWDTPVDNFRKILANDTYIIVMGDEEYGTISRKEHTLNISTAQRLGDIDFYNEDSFLLVKNAELVRLEYATLMDTDGELLSDGQKVAGDSENGIYLYDERNIYFMDAFGGNTSVYEAFWDTKGLTDAQADGENIYVIVDNRLMYNRADEEPAEEQVLTIVGGLSGSHDPRFAKAIEIFTARNPEYTVKLTESQYGAQLRTAVMANEPGYDLFLMDSKTSTDFKISGILVDFSENEVITENIAQYMDMPFLWEDDGSLYGIPVRVFTKGFSITRALLNEIDIDIDRNWTWDEFFALKDVAKELGLRLIDDDMSWWGFREWYESAYCDYAAGEANYDTDAFRKLAGIWKQLSEEDMINYDPAKTGNVLLKYGFGCPVQGEDRYVHLGMPAMDGEIITPIDLPAFYVNCYGEQTDAAIEFLEIFSSPEVQFESQVGSELFLSDLESYTEYSLWQMFNWIPTDEQMEQWQHFLSTGKQRGTNQEFNKGVKELVSAYLADEITVDEFALEMQERADLMVGE